MYDNLAEAMIADTETRFPVLREVLREDLAHYPDDDLVVAAQQIVPGVDLELLEFSLGDLGRSLGPAMSQVGQVMGRAAPGALSGALGGAAAGAALGPYGMLAGAAIGAVGGGIKSYNASRPQAATSAPARQAPMRPAQVAVTQRPASSRRPAQRSATPQPPAMNPAVAQMFQLLSRPEVIQAILAASAGALGRQTTQIGGQTVATQSVLDVVRMPVTEAEMDGEYAAHDARLQVLELLEQTPTDAHPLLFALEHASAIPSTDWEQDARPIDYSPSY